MKWISLIAIASATAFTAVPALANPQQAMTKAGCMACHSPERKLVGPSFKDIAAKNKGQEGAVAALMQKVRKGTKGVYGPVPMIPTGPDKISDDDLKAAIEMILGS